MKFKKRTKLTLVWIALSADGMSKPYIQESRNQSNIIFHIIFHIMAKLMHQSFKISLLIYLIFYSNITVASNIKSDVH